MSLSSILEEIKKLKPLAEEDVSSGPSNTLNGRRGRKNQAVESLKRLKRDYKKEMTKSSVFIISTGSGREEFTKIATENFGWFSADADLFYADLANRIPPVLYLNKESVSNIFDVIGRHLEDKMVELDINEYNQLIFKSGLAKVVKSKEDFTALVKFAINNQIGAEIAGVQAIESLIDSAIEKNHKDSIMPIILTIEDDKFALELLKDLKRITKKVFILTTGESSDTIKSVEGAILLKEANKNSVGIALKSMSKSLKK
jgi:hypothetical protein